MTYSAIIADPPWQYASPRALVGNGGRGNIGANKIIQADVNQHYKTMSLDEIKNISIPSNKNCLLFMWVTNPFLCDGSGTDVVKAWGFEPKSIITWVKIHATSEIRPSMKTGHWFRSASEHVIFATKGIPKRPENYPALPTWFAHPRLPHSVKPDIIHQYAETMMPHGPWLEMFARRERYGWDLWGDQAPFFHRPTAHDDLFGPL